MKQIDSKDNPNFKEIVRIKQLRTKEPHAEVFIEGARLCMEAQLSGVDFTTVLVSRSRFDQSDSVGFDASVEILILADHLFDRLCATRNPQGIAAVVKSPVLYDLGDLAVRGQDKYLLCESIQDPGNLGGMIRSADAFGFSGVLFTRDTVDPFNEKVLRSSMGSVFHVPLVCIESIQEAIDRLRLQGVTTYATYLKGRDIPAQWRFQLPCAILMGNEGQGVREETASRCDHLLRIPMPGKAESLNVSNATAILCYLASIPNEYFVNPNSI